MNMEGIDFFETYAPVLQWKTVLLMIILEVFLGLKSKQDDVTATFIHVYLGKDEKVFVEMPRGFEVKGKNGRPRVLKLLKTLYGLRQSPRAFWKYMTAKIKFCGMVQSKTDTCLFIGKKVMAIIYVDNILFWYVNENNIHYLAMQLRDQGVDLEQEDDIAGLLGATLGHEKATGIMEMKQVSLINRVLETLRLNYGMANNKYTTS